MPVYIRQGELEIPAPSVSSVDTNEQDVFVLDPEMVVDTLPQPYRMLNKILDRLLDDTWETIVEREAQREAARKIEIPPLFQAHSTVDAFASATCICHSGDGRYIFVSFETGEISAFDSANLNRIAEWKSEEVNACFEYVTTDIIGPNIHLLATVDDMGFARLYAFVDEAFYLIYLFNEQPEGSPKSNAKKFDLSKHGDFCGLALECDGSAWIEIYKIPRDSWIREIEVAQKDLAKRSLVASDTSVQAETQAAVTGGIGNENLEIKFSALAVVLKIKSPPPLVGSCFASQQEALEKVGFPNTVGNGTYHLFTDEHLALRRAVVKNVYAEHVTVYEPNIEPSNTPNWHYLFPARLQADAISASFPIAEDIPVSVCVWWKHHHLAQTYQLQTKPSKELELKPDIVWPMSSKICCSTISECSTIVAFGLENGFISLIDRHLCQPVSMANIGQKIPVASIAILNFPTDNSTFQANSPSVYCLATLANGSVVFVDCASDHCKVIIRSVDVENTDVFVKPFDHFSHLFLHSNGTKKVSLRDLISGNILCELALAESLEEAKKRFSFAIDDGALYVKNDDGTVHMFSLKDIDVLQQRLIDEIRKQTYKRHETIEERCQRLFTERIKQQAARTHQLESTWNSLDKKLSVLIGLKNAGSTTSEHSSVFSKWNRADRSVIFRHEAASR